MLLDIITYPSPVLRNKCEPVGEITAEIQTLANDMLETMYAARGVGLAAPQVGKNITMIVLDPSPEEESRNPKVYINPEIELIGQEVISENEGCLSVPLNYRANVPRNSCVKLKARDLNGQEINEEIEGFEAIILQHEIDHLHGVLFIDKLSHLNRKIYDTKIKKWIKRKKEE